MRDELVLDVGCGDDPDERATLTADVRSCGDLRFSATDAWPIADGAVDGIIINHVIEHFTRGQVGHVFREAARVLDDGGWLEISVPLGANYRTDLDHERSWTWETPATLSVDHRRGWDPDVPFRLTDRDVRMWGVRPFGFVTPVVRLAYRAFGGGLWATEIAHAPLMAGELTARYEVVA